jgi:DNA invertase Pin-like site-specific DNA recombinase
MTTPQPKLAQKRAAIYARYSSERQDKRSCEDQIAECRLIAERCGYRVVDTFQDDAVSGRSMDDRIGAEALLEGVKAGRYDVVIVEAQSRLARSPGDVAYMTARFKNKGVVLHTRTGIASNLESGLRAVIDAEFSNTLADFVKRGMNARAREGKFPGKVPYGYRRLRDMDRKGEIEIDPVHAVIVQRIFSEYVNGKSVREIARDLTRDKIPTPTGGQGWSHQTFLGCNGANRGTLGNVLYIGEQVYGKQFTVVDPDTHRKSRKPYPDSDHITNDLPHLRIIDQHLWDAAQQRRRDNSNFAEGGVIVRKTIARNKTHLLSGLLRCGACNGNMIVASVSRGRSYVKCRAAHNKSACEHARLYDIEKMKALVLENLRDKTADPEWMLELMNGYNSQYAELGKTDDGERAGIERQLSKLKIQRGRILDLISEGELSDDEVAEQRVKLAAKERERAGLAERLRQIDGPANVVLLHPKGANAFKENVARFRRVLIDEIDGEVGVAAFRLVMDSIVIQPSLAGQDYVIDAFARPAAFLDETCAFPKPRSIEEIIAAEGVSRGAIQASRVTPSGRYRTNSEAVIPLGRWCKSA